MALIHVVQPGDTLWALAKRYIVRLEDLLAVNPSAGDRIVPGQELLIPVASEKEAGEKEEPVLSTPILPSLEGGFVLPEDYYSQEDLDDIGLLARLVYAEARGEPFTGQIAVAAVLLNRLQHPGFPDSVRAAVYQPRQFEVVSNGTINQTPNNLAYLAVLEARKGVDPTHGSVFFWNPRKVAPSSWVWTQTVRLQIGNHVFA